jgi:hypothetical protein
MWCDSFNSVFFCRGFIRHAVGSFVTANPMEQSVRFHTMGPRHPYEAVKRGGGGRLSQRQRHVSITFLLYFKVTGVTQSASTYSMTSQKSIPMPTACEVDVTSMRAPSFLRG